MNKILLIILCACTFACNTITAQCTPNLTGPASHINPDTTINLPICVATIPYTADIQIFVTHDTTYLLTAVPITDFTLTSVMGLPAGFSYACVPTNCVFPGGTAGCFHISGTATDGMAGTYPLTVVMTAHVVYASFTIPIADTVRGYRIVIDSASHAGVPTLVGPAKFDVYQNAPNPFNGTTEIDYSSAMSGKVNLKVFNVLGSTVMNRTYDAKTGMNQVFINSKELAPGIYMYSLSNGIQTITKRMIVTAK